MTTLFDWPPDHMTELQYCVNFLSKPVIQIIPNPDLPKAPEVKGQSVNCGGRNPMKYLFYDKRGWGRLTKGGFQ